MKTLLVSLTLLPFLLSCNVYSPFAQKGSTEDLLEEGQKCLHNNDYGCAIEAYSAISVPEIKNQKLCEAYLAQGGMTLTMLINTITENNASMLGGLAQAMVPWSTGQTTALASAKTSCADYLTTATTTASQNKAALLKALSLLTHCASLMAKSDQFIATSESDTACNTAGNRSGTVTKADISANTNGTITGGGMCAEDVLACNSDVVAVDTTALANAGVTDIKNAYNQIPAALRSSQTSANAYVAREALRGTVD